MPSQEGDAMEAVAGVQPEQPRAGQRSGPPETLYRHHVEECDRPQNAFTYDFMCDYLTMMDVLAKVVARELEGACGITPLQYRIMLRLLPGGGVQAKELAADIGVGASTVSVAVGKLCDKRLVERRESAADMRAVELTLSPQGSELVRRADEAVLAVMSQYWDSLTQEQFEAARASSLSAVERHSHPRVENGQPRIDTALVDTVMISRALTAHALQEEGLTTGDYRVMLALKVMGGRCPSAAVAKFLFLNSSDITSCLRNLEAMGLITRQRSQENRRVRMVELTAAGGERLAALLPVVFDALHETCHSSDELIRVHISAARDLVARKRQRSEF